MTTLFRTQDTKASWARKINAAFAPPLAPRLREVPQTLEQWQHELNALVDSLVASGYVLPTGFVFRVGDPRWQWTKNLNAMLNAQAAGTKPVNTALPTISGTATVGQVLTAANGTWTGAATITYAYQWLRDGVDIGGATASTYTLVSADQTHKVSVRVTATNSLGSSSATSAQTATVA